MITHTDEILQSAVSTDTTAVPRYNLVRPDGTVVERNVALKLANAIAREGTPVNKPLLDEFLAASGVTAGSATAYTLAQEGYELFDGAPVRFQLHAASGDGATLDINGTGAKPLVDMMGEPMAGGISAETWLTAMYSAAAGTYVLAGGEAVQALYGERYAVDAAVAYVKDVPGDALPYAEVGEVGGMTYKVNVGTEEAPVYELRSAAVTEVESVGVNLWKSVTTQTLNGVTLTVDENDVCTLNGTCTASGNIVSGNYKLPAGTYWLSDNAQGTFPNNTNARIQAYFTSTGASLKTNNNSSSDAVVSITLTEDAQCAQRIRIESGHTYNNCKLYPMLNRGSTALPYTPYVRHIHPIPEAVRPANGINDTVYDSIRWENDGMRKKYQCVGVVDMGTLGWEKNGSNNIYYAAIADGKYYGGTTLGKALCAKYPTVANVVSADDALAFGNNFIGSGNCPVVVHDESYTDAASFKLAMSGVMLYYELAEPIITDISSLLPADNLLPVEAGGTITAVNAHGYAVPTTITYQRNVLANRASTYALKKLRLALELLASIDYVDEAIKPLATTTALNAAVAPLAKSNLSNASGTFAGAVKANADAAATLGTAQVRNVTISATDLTAGSSALATGDSYHVYS